ncbi:PRC-barrel domain-containing protein [Halodurantibacterium flavum]|uniref:PRC-barrel domain-containing protein n=1 Tax=Halodurantibacterium flavum TaxID=1382802 RepID=A0ABW4S7G5_9RHOB
MKMKNTLISSVLLASVAAFPGLAQQVQAPTDTETDIVSPTEEGVTQGDATGTTPANPPGSTAPVLPPPDQPSAVTGEGADPSVASPGMSSPDPAPGDPTGGTAGSTSIVDPTGGDATATTGETPTPGGGVAEGTAAQPQTGAGDGALAGAQMVSPPDGYEPFSDPRTLTAETLTGQNIYGSDDQNISTVSDLVLDAEGAVVAVIADVGGFLGFGARSVTVPYEELQIFRSGQNDIRVYLPMTQEELEALPEYMPEAEGGTGEFGEDTSPN